VLADGVLARGHLFEAQALVHLSGELVSLEDLVLHDAGMDSRAPSTGVVRAARELVERRSLARRAPETVLATDTLRRLIGLVDDDARATEPEDETAQGEARAGVPARPIGLQHWQMPKPFADDGLWPNPDEIDDGAEMKPLDAEDGELLAHDSSLAITGDLAAVDALLARTGHVLDAIERPLPETAPLRLRDLNYDAAARLDAWLSALKAAEDAPAVLATAIALDAWLSLEPAERSGEVGFALAATVLRQREVALHHLPALGLGLRKGGFRWSPHQAQSVRLAGLIEAIAASAKLADNDLKRLTLAREVMLRRCEGNLHKTDVLFLLMSSVV
jgi:hypothetical protein